MKIWTNASTLCLSIAHIVEASSKPQMIWIYTTGIVTTMKNLYRIWDFPNIQTIGVPMRNMKFPVLELAVSFAILSSDPIPASVTLNEFRFESCQAHDFCPS